MNPHDVFMLKTAAGLVTGKMIAAPIHVTFTLWGAPWLGDMVVHALAEALRQVL